MNHTVATDDLMVDERKPSQISWGAVFAGWITANAVAWVLYILGTAVGLTAIGATEAEAETAGGAALATGAWILISWAASLFLGGLFAARLAGKSDRSVGGMHGITVWGLATIATILLGVMGVTNLLQAGKSVMSGTVSAAGLAASGAAAAGGADGNTGLQAEIQNRVSQAIANAAQNAGAGAGAGQVTQSEVQSAIRDLDARTTSQIAARLMSGDTDGARSILASQTGLAPAEVDQIMAGLSVQADQYKNDLRRAADTSAEYSATLLWAVFLASGVGLIMAIVGGRVGAAQAECVYRHHLNHRGNLYEQNPHDQARPLL